MNYSSADPLRIQMLAGMFECHLKPATPRAEEYLGFEPLKELPSHYREHVYFSVQYERVAIKERQHVGVDRIMFATDFPHIQNGWPNSRPMIDNILERDKRKIWAGNAVEFFKLDQAA